MKAVLTGLMLAFGFAMQAQTVDHPLSIGGDVRAPQLVKTTDFILPQEACTQTHSPHAVLTFVVGTDGIPSHVSVRGTNLTNQYVARLISTFEGGYRWRPATRNGAPVAVVLNMEVNIDCF